MTIKNAIVKKVFDDLDAYRDFCRFGPDGRIFDERALYNRKDRNWQAYEEQLAGGVKKKPYKPKRTFQK